MKFNKRFWAGTVAAWAAASMVLYLFHVPLLGRFWAQHVASGVVRPDYNSLATNAIFAIGIFLGVYIMCEFLEKLSKHSPTKSLKYGAMFGLLVGLTEAGQALLYFVPFTLGLAYAVADVTAFSIAAFVYQQIETTRHFNLFGETK